MGEVTGEGGRFWGVVDSGGGGKGGVVIPDSVGGNGGGGKGGGGGEGMPESSGVSGEPLGGDTSLTISSSTCSYTRFGGGPGGVRGLGGVWVPGGGGVSGAASQSVRWLHYAHWPPDRQFNGRRSSAIPQGGRFAATGNQSGKISLYLVIGQFLTVSFAGASQVNHEQPHWNARSKLCPARRPQ